MYRVTLNWNIEELREVEEIDAEIISDVNVEVESDPNLPYYEALAQHLMESGQ